MFSYLTRFNFFVKYALIENKKRYTHFFLCIFSCYLVGLVCLISKTILNEGPVIFLMITEQKTGENDLIIKPEATTKSNRNNISDYQIFNSNINYTLFKNLFEKNKFQSTPRLQIRGTGKITEKSTSIFNEVTMDLFVMDLKQEKEIELGTSFPYSELNQDECLIHQNIARLLNIDIEKYNNKTNKNNEDYYLNLTVNFQQFLKNFLIRNYYLNITHPFYNNSSKIPSIYDYDITFPCKIRGIFEENFGKLNQDSHTTIVMEYKNFYGYISNYIKKNILDIFPDLISEIKTKINPYDYSDIVIVNFPKPRINSYTVANFDDLQMKGVDFANTIIKELGNLSTNFKIELPIIENIKPLFNGAVFLGLILNIIIICLFALSILLIFSLLQISVETRIYEFGILRIIGSSKTNIILLILIQCLIFSIPSFILAYLSHIYILDGIQNLLSSVTETNLKLTPEFSSIIYSLVMTNLVPLLAAFYPIKSVFKDSLAYSLNTNLNKTSGVKIEVHSAIESEKKTLIIFGFLVFLYGISIYYFLPLSMLSMNWGLLLFIFLWILLGMLTGLVILSMSLESITQNIVVYLFFFWTKASDKLLILKNLTAHRIRNRQTSIMYSLSVGFFILVEVGLKIELKTQEMMSLLKTGSYYELKNANSSPLKPHQIFPTLFTMKKLNLIEDFTFITPNFNYLCRNTKNSLSNLGKMKDIDIDLFGIPGNYFDVAISDFLKIDEEDNYDLSISEKLYMDKFHGGMGISGIFTWEMDVKMNDNFFLNVFQGQRKMSLILEPGFILHSAPGLKMSAEPIAMMQRAAVIPIHTYIDLLNKCSYYINKKDKRNNFRFDEYSKFSSNTNKFSYSYNDFPIHRILIKINKKLDNKYLFDKLGDVVNYDPSYIVGTWSYFDHEKKLDKISIITTIIFNSVNLIILVFCFFNLSASMTININEQKKEISILRSMGLTKFKLNCLYQAEAFVLIFSSSIMGLIVGTMVSFTMTLQQVMFTNLPITFVFPYTKVVFLIVVSIVSGSLSTVIPAKIMLSQSISNMIKTG